MQYKRLNDSQRGIKHWRDARNRIVTVLMAKDPTLSGWDALAEANRVMRERQGGIGRRKPTPAAPAHRGAPRPADVAPRKGETRRQFFARLARERKATPARAAELRTLVAEQRADARSAGPL